MLILAHVAETRAQSYVPEEFDRYDFEFDGKQIPYYLYQPPDSPNDEKYPLIVALHGAENFLSSQEDFLRYAGYYATGWLDSSLQKQYPSFVIAPHINDPLSREEGYHGWENSKTIVFLDSLLNYTMEKYNNIDKNRVYLTGHSMGGSASFEVPFFIKNRFAATMPLNTANGCTNLCPLVEDGVYDYLPIWITHHRRDGASKIRNTINTFDSLGLNMAITHSFGNSNVNLSKDSIASIINSHQKYFYTEYNFPCNDYFQCHTTAADSIIRDEQFRQWVFRQYKQQPESIEIQEFSYTNNQDDMQVSWLTEYIQDNVEIWIRHSPSTGWEKVDEVLAEEKEFIFSFNKPLNNPEIKLVIINQDGFAFGQDQSFIRKVTSLPDDFSNDKLIIYPNPSENVLKIKSHLNLNIGSSYSITSIDGRSIQSGLIIDNSIDISFLSNGLYCLYILSENSTYTCKFIKTMLNRVDGREP